MAEGFNGVAMDQPAGSGNRPWAAESWLEPWLTKHSEFYRKHLTRDGRRESKSTRRSSVVAEALESRKNSIAVPEADVTAAADHEAEAAAAMPAAAQEPRESLEAEGQEGATKKEKGINWRKSVGWFPHP